MRKKDEFILDSSGQVFLEFLFLLLVLMTISFGFIKGFNSATANRWQALIKVIADPSPTSIEIN